MTIVRWNPTQEVRPFAGTMARTFDDLFNGYGWTGPSFPWNSWRGNGNAAWEPSVDIYETTEDVVVRAELPGMRREDITLTLENGVLTIQGERAVDAEASADQYHRLERRYGRFVRSFSLPGMLNHDNIQAEYTDGLLTIRLPKTESAKPRRIEIAA